MDVENPTSPEDDSCRTALGGVLTIKGFDMKRESAVIEYTTPTDGSYGGCMSGMYFFYLME